MLRNIASTPHILPTPDKDQVQPNAVDLRIDKVFRILPTDFFISEDKKQHRKTEQVYPDVTLEYYLEPGQSYQFDCKEQINVPAGYAGWLIARSTLNRNGIFITSGL